MTSRRHARPRLGSLRKLPSTRLALIVPLEAELVRERRFLASMIDQSFDGVVATDERRRITVVNPAAEQLLALAEQAEERADKARLNNAGGAAQIASVVLVLVILLVTLEKYSRRRLRFFNMSGRHRPVPRQALTGLAGWAAFAACFLPFAIGFLLPASVIASHALGNAERWADPELLTALRNTLLVCGIAAVVTVLGGVFMVYGVRLSGHKLPRLLLHFGVYGADLSQIKLIGARDHRPYEIGPQVGH